MKTISTCFINLISKATFALLLLIIVAGCTIQVEGEQLENERFESEQIASAEVEGVEVEEQLDVATAAPEPTLQPASPTVAPTAPPPTSTAQPPPPPTVAPTPAPTPTQPIAHYDQLPIFDTHVHYSEDAWSAFSPAEIIQKFINSDVGRAMVSSSPDEGTRRLYAQAPEMIVPFARLYHGNATSSDWYFAEGIYEYLQGLLETHPYQGIGEFHLHSSANVTLPSVQNTIREAVARDIYLFIHTDAASVTAVFNFEPNAKIFWAHAGMSEPPEVVSAMMDQYPNLWTDLSYREYQIIAPDGQIAPEWMKLFIRHQDRITVGSDTWITPRWRGYEQTIAQHRLYLDQLPPDIAEKIAFRNAVRLFGGGEQFD